MIHRVYLRCDPAFGRSATGLADAARIALDHEEAPPGELTVVLTSTARMQQLNRDFAGEDRPTDVLSFGDGTPDPETGLVYFGDIVIAVPVASDQASAAGHTLAAELGLLTVHGVLHLLGHEHAQAQERSRMEAAQEAILGRWQTEAGAPREVK